MARGAQRSNSVFVVLVMAEKIQSKDEFAALIEKSISQYENLESDSKVINLGDLAENVELTSLEKSLYKAFNTLFSAITNISLKLSSVEKSRDGSIIGAGGKGVGVGGKGVGGGGDGGRIGGREGVTGASGTMAHSSANNSWVTPSHAEGLKGQRLTNQRIDRLESEVDEYGQRGLKGMVILSAPDFKYISDNKVPIPSLFQGMKSFNQDQESTKEDELHDLEKVISLIDQKYDVKVPMTEVYGCHFLPNGMYCMRFVYRNPTNSAWAELMKKMRTGGDTELNFYCNIQLTRKRRQLFNAVRKLKYEKRIQQFNVNVNGEISMKFKEKWLKITQYYSTSGEFFPTRNVNDLDRLIGR